MLENLVGDIKRVILEEELLLLILPNGTNMKSGCYIPLDTNKISKGRIFGDDQHSMYGLLGTPPCLSVCKRHPGVMP